MLHILWLLIKCILVLLGIVLILLLLLAGVLLFCPLRYRVYGKKEMDSLEALGRVSWLFGAVSWNFSYETQEGLTQTLRIFGVSGDRYRKLFQGFGHKKKKPKDPESKRESLDFPDKPGIEISEETQNKKEVQLPKEPDTAMNQTSGYEVSSDMKTENRLLGLLQIIKNFFEKIISFFRNIFERFREIWKAIVNFRFTIKKICDRIGQMRTFLQDERTKTALRLVWRDLKKLLGKIGPRRISGSVRFGLEDPASTGQVLAILGMTYPIHRNRVQIYPDFQNSVLEGELRLQGRIYGVSLLCIAWELFRSPDLRYVIQKMRS